MKLATKRSLQQTHISQASGSGADEGTSSIPGVPDVPTDESEEEISWNSTDEEGDDDEGKDGDGDGDDDDDGEEEGDGDDDEDDDGEEGNDDDDDQEVKEDDEKDDEKEEPKDEESFDPIPKTPNNTDDEGNGEENLDINVGREEGHDEEEDDDELYRDVNINQGRDISSSCLSYNRSSEKSVATNLDVIIGLNRSSDFRVNRSNKIEVTDLDVNSYNGSSEKSVATDLDFEQSGSESRPPMLNKENYVPWSSRLICYAKSRPNGKLIHNSIINGPYVRRKIPKLEFAQIVDIPCEGACVFNDKWSLDELAYGVPTDGPYQTNPPFPDDIISSIRIDREGQVCRIRYEEEINVLEYQILTREIMPTLKPLEEIIQENFNLAYYMAKQMELVTRQKRLILPYGMLLTRLFKVIMNENHELYNESYVLYVHVMNPLSAQQERKPRKDRSTRRGRHSTSSSSAFDQLSQPKIFRTLNDYFTLTFLAATTAALANFQLISGHHPLLTIADLHPIKTPPSPPYPQPPNHHTTTVYILPSRHHHHPHTTLTLVTNHHHHVIATTMTPHHHLHHSTTHNIRVTISSHAITTSRTIITMAALLS
nr:hypothetical protein [Tanacetum cinerariifolium]